MATFRIALLQLAPRGTTPDANLPAGLEACRRAAAMGADLALFPEVWSNGYTPCPTDEAGRRAWRAGAVAPGDGFLEAHQALAAELGMAIAVTYLERHPAGPRNTVAVVDRFGEVRLTYAKVHICDFADGTDLGMVAGDRFDTAELDTAAGPVRVGAMICFDREFPESARLLMIGGAEVILVPNACPLEPNRMGQLRSRAFENMVAVATANYPHDGGRSAAFSPIAFDANECSLDTCLVEAGEDEGVWIAEVDLAALRHWRAREVFVASRRPELYGPLGVADGPPA